MSSTAVHRLSPTRPDAVILAKAAAVLRAGGLVAFPTETVYGLGANALDAAAVLRESPSPLRLVVAGVDEDAMDPRFEAVGFPQVRDPAPGEHESVLQRVLGETGVAQDPLGDRVEAVADLVHQDGEGLSVPVAGLLDEVSIHV